MKLQQVRRNHLSPTDVEFWTQLLSIDNENEPGGRSSDSGQLDEVEDEIELENNSRLNQHPEENFASISEELSADSSDHLQPTNHIATGFSIPPGERQTTFLKSVAAIQQTKRVRRPPQKLRE